MLRSTSIILEFPAGVRVNSSMGSLLHGALMEKVAASVAEQLHTMSLRPYSQVVYWDNDKKKAIWRIGTLSDEIYTQLIGCLQQQAQLTLKHKGYEVKLQQMVTEKEISFEELAARFIQSSLTPAGVIWDTLSVMSFKQQGRYVILPDARLMYQSLLLRWNAFSPKIKLETDHLADKLAAHCTLTRYNLHSRLFSVEGTNIYGCYGRQQYCFFGYDMLKRIQGLLAAFAEFSGVGVKTALGMGAVQTQIDWK